MFSYTLPSGRETILREMTGVEEEILTNQRLQREGTAINQVLLNCLVRLDENDGDGSSMVESVAGAPPLERYRHYRNLFDYDDSRLPRVNVPSKH